MLPGRILTVLLLVGGACLPARAVDASRELAAMVETERAFARTCVEKGVRESFFRFFAEEGVGFQPGPVRIREAYAERPATAGRPPITLDWEPVYGDISEGADLGYLTGPFVVTDRPPGKRPPRHGYYFSVWRKQADGSWRVAADMGIRTPPAEGDLPRNRFDRARAGASTASGAATAGERDASLRAAEAALLEDAAARGLARAYLAVLAEQARLHREGDFPFTTRESIRGHLESQPPAGRWETMHVQVSESDDLGYTYGSYELTREGAAVQKGYYLRVWRRDGEALWRIVADVATALPEGS